MAQQTSYANNPAPAINGLVAFQEGEVIWSKVAESAVPIGMLAIPGTQSLSAPAATISLATSGEAGTVKQMSSGVIADDPILDSEFVGIPIFDAALMQSSQIGTLTTGTQVVSTYLDKMSVPVMRKGRIWVLSENATTQFADVYVRTTVAVNAAAGSFSMSAGAGKVKFARGRWLMTTSGAGLSLLEVW